ncbi:alpha/beta hydrolase [Corynebacterium provencense]|uniref:alpha/beta hydrolase n=1 Tax=Corynebacterium provencense TaxID=1737425 RepID=UPI00082E3656|nr:alpha/beta hydrolase-fold protein [Corynebacterium provencense]
MPDFLRSVPLVGTQATVVFLIVGLICLLALSRQMLWRPGTTRRRRLTVLCTVAAVTVIVCAALLVYVVVGIDVGLSEIPPAALAGGVLTVVAVVTVVTGFVGWMRQDRGTRGTLRPVRSSVLVGGVLLTSVLLLNVAFNLYPEVGSLRPGKAYEETDASDLPRAVGSDGTVSVTDWQDQDEHTYQGGTQPKYGSVVTMPVPTPASGFAARDAQVYLPPAWFSEPRPALPVLVLMAGIPGAPSQWFGSGRVGDVAHRYQRTHGGLSPVVAVVDATGSTWGNPVCTDSPTAKVQTFLSKDVPSWLVGRFDADPDQSHWAIGGLSYGGTCALQVVANAPEAYGMFLDFSGERRPTAADGSHETTVREFYGGSQVAFAAANPEDLFHAHASDGRYADVVGWFIAGKRDSSVRNDLSALADAAQAAGVDVTVQTVPGAHDFGTWREAIRRAFPAVAEHAGLAG